MFCANRGDLIGTYNVSGKVFDSFNCLKHRKPCAENDNPLKILACSQCDDLDFSTSWINCPNRGEPVGVIDAPGCGCDRTVYACSEKGRCLKRLPLARTAASLGSQLDGVTICKSCEFFPKEPHA
ncbi:hypothetical protein [Schlesneria paludicola]|uniref:hypothetical protein n=1 Tax=Schlesneria paludicola TaxID=360056 RepID=UPI00029AE944|nr:hypothetical protein [Schlesneria paludicola]